MMIKLEIRNLSFGYHSADILKDFSLTVSDGHIVSIVGPNGSGKSTLIKCIDRILTPRSGRVTVDHRNAGDMGRMELARRIAYIPQSSLRVFPNTVFDVVLMGRRPYLGWASGPANEESVWEILSLLDIEDIALRPFNELSGGQQQKVLIARALAQDTGVVLLDEPTSNLDVRHQMDVMDILRDLVKKRSLTVLIAIHDLNTAARYSDRIVMMKRGRIVVCGKPGDVMNERNLEEIYGIRSEVRFINNIPFVLPLGRVNQKQNR